jgi:CubicO group peptidase (beta-lactamase class C family)
MSYPNHPVDGQGAADRLVYAGAGSPGATDRWDLRTRRPMEPDLHFRIGSATKAFVAALVLKLVSEGTVSLSDTTIRQLLNHTAGVPQYTDVVWRELYRSSERCGARSWSAPRRSSGGSYPGHGGASAPHSVSPASLRIALTWSERRL